jgi:diaminopimelate decarboxylase
VDINHVIERYEILAPDFSKKPLYLSNVETVLPKKGSDMPLNPHSDHIQNIPLQSLADEYGTPLYVYDASIIDRQINRLRSAFSGFPHRVNYAAKALTNLAVLKHMHTRDLGLDVVSVYELRMGLDAGFAPSDILFTSNSIHFSELQEAIGFGVNINIDSLSLLEKFGREYGGSYPCSIRLKLDPLIETHEASGKWHRLSKFGIHHSRAGEIKTIIQTYNLNVIGLHVHNSSGFLDVPVYLATADTMFSIAKQFPELQFIDFGGGITIPFYEGHQVIDVDELGKKLSARVHEFYAEYGGNPGIWFEPGRFLVSECGVLLTAVTVLKDDREPSFAGTDTGFNHLLRPAMYDAYHEIVNLSNPGGNVKEYHITGNMCETDFLGKNRMVGEIREGDLLAIKNAGAYGSSMASNYNSRPRPAEVMIRDGKAHLIKKRETYEDLIRNQARVW